MHSSPIALTLVATMLILPRGYAADAPRCQRAPTTWKLGTTSEFLTGPNKDFAKDIAKAIRPGEKVTSFTESGTNGSMVWSHGGIALIRNGCLVASFVMSYMDGQKIQPPSK